MVINISVKTVTT